jgi:hypothetical protein
MSTFEQQIARVKAARFAADAKAARIRGLRAGFEDTIKKEVFEANELKERVVTDEHVLKEMTLAAYARDPTNKKPAPGVGIRVSHGFDYDINVALEYAKTNLPAMTETVLREAEFDSWVGARLDSGADLPIPVTTKKTVTATISKEL